MGRQAGFGAFFATEYTDLHRLGGKLKCATQQAMPNGPVQGTKKPVR